ncbi:CPBP family intramembrane metalloprotease [[Clostridium] spiroforme]|nr:CPBP family intramembrane metalloprotease [Thomasclavelia spiroformis]MBM6879352.1 CPBP family intramembrane metalloprotease [Thomasclavelia spiroformis]
MDLEFAGRLNGKQKAIGFILLLPTYLYITPTLVEAGLYFFVKYVKVLDIYTINIYLNFFSTLISMIFAVVLFKDFFIDNIRKFKQNLSKNILWSATAGLGINYLISYLANILIILFLGTSDSASNQLLFESLIENSFLLMAIQAIVFAPIVEELIFRGLVFRSFRQYNIYLAHFISAFCFGFIHIYQGLFAGDFTQLVYLLSYGGMGFAYSFVYEKRKTIVAPMIVHMLNNLIATIIIML